MGERNDQTAFRGWLIVGIAAASQALAIGTTFFSYGVFVKPLAAEFEASRLVVILGMTLMMLMQGIVSPVLGRLLDRRSIRAVMASGAAICATGFLGLSFATTLWQVGLLVGTLIAVGSHMFGPLATSTLIANWFQQMRGRALGITAIGASVGGLVFPVVATGLLEEFGWRGAAAMFAALLSIFVLPLWLLVIDRPERIGQRPDGMPADPATRQAGGHGRDAQRGAPSVPGAEAPAQQPADRAAGRGARVSQEPLLRSRNLWVITAAIGLAFCSTSTFLAHLVPYATDLGHDPRSAAFLMSAYSGSGALGRLLCGLLVDRIDKRFASWIVFGILMASWTALVVAPSYFALLVACAGMGFGVGGIMPLWGALTGACFGRARFGQAMGLMTPLMLPFNLLGAPIAAYAFDQTGSYTLVFSAFLATFVIGAAIIALLRIPAVEPGDAS